MKYIPITFGLEGEIEAIKSQSYGTNVAPFLQIVKDIKVAGGKASVLNELEEVVKLKSNNTFFVTIPKNYDLTKKLKKPINAFYTKLITNPSYEFIVYNRFTKYSNVIPVIEVDFDSYTAGNIGRAKAQINTTSGSYAYRVHVDKLSLIESELNSLVTSNDYIIYDLDSEFLYFKGKIRSEVIKLESIKKKKSCQLIVVKQIYENLTFTKMPNRKIISTDLAYKCIDYSFYSDFKASCFDHFGDWAGIRNVPIYEGGMPYPAYLTVEIDTFEHHGFCGIQKDNGSFKTTLLPKYSASVHWNSLLPPLYKAECFSCQYISNFISGTDKPNSAQKWKTITLAHFYKSTDYKIRKGHI